MEGMNIRATIRARQTKLHLKSKFVSLQTTHNTTTTSLQHELDKLRQEHQKLKIQLRDLEMGNDDLERNERAVSSSLADVEAKYAKALEEKILLEHELLDKANLEEEFQRMKDEIRGMFSKVLTLLLPYSIRVATDANLEITVLKDQLTQAQAQLKAAQRPAPKTEASSDSAASSWQQSLPSASDNIMSTTPPAEMHLSDLTPKAPTPSELSRTSSQSSSHYGTSRNPSSSGESSGQSALLRRAGFPAAWMNGSSSPGEKSTGMTRSHTVSSYSPSRLPITSPRSNATPRFTGNTLTISTNSANGIAAKSRGVQMVSEMRARVRNLEQKLHTRVPRIRMGSISGKKAESTANAAANSISTAATTSESSWKNTLKRKSADLEAEKKKTPLNPAKEPKADTSGWVLIMEDSMNVTPTREKERRRLSSPSSSPFSLSTMTKSASTQLTDLNLGKSGIRRPQSRLSGDGRDSTSTVSTTSSIPTPTSRPATPTFLPVPTPGLYGSGLPTMKRSTGPTAVKRSSLGANSVNNSPTSLHPLTHHHRERPLSALAASTNKMLPPPPSNITVRAPRPPSALGQSRIGRPSGGRKSIGDEAPPIPKGRDASRSRSGSTNGGRV